MDTPRHERDDRITIARVCGTGERYATRLANPANGPADFDAGVAELRSITTDPHLLAHGTAASDIWFHDTMRELLIAAGADPAAMEEVRAIIDRRRGSPDLLAQLAERIDSLPRSTPLR
jgi:hypothetical protein